jgi:hypothetical protein
VLRGWGNYFRRGNSTRKFYAVDMYVAHRMARVASIKHGLRGINWKERLNYAWLRALGVYRLTGPLANGVRMPDDERCRRAVCGRTARTVRYGAAGNTEQHCRGC